jgi:tRNA nucleotidyltransferase (CCA-adding enzyme)
MNIPKEVIKVLENLKANNFSAYIVGGALRDYYLGLQPVDYDIVSDATPNDIKKIFKKTVQSGKNHDTIRIIEGDYAIDATTFRGEIYSDPYKSLLSDLERRDFTINSMAYDYEKELLIDPFDSVKNLKSEIVLIKSNNAIERFKEDPLRILRTLTLGEKISKANKKWLVDKKTLQAAKQLGHLILSVAYERIGKELKTLLDSKKSYVYFDLIRKASFLPFLKLNQDNINCLEKASNLEVKIGCVFCKNNIQNSEELMKKLGFKKSIIKNVVLFLTHANDEIPSNDEEIRRLIYKMGKNRVLNYIEFKSCCFGLDYNDTIKKIEFYIQNNFPLEIKDLAVNGDELIERFGINQGKEIGKILNILMEEVLRNPENNKKEVLFKMVESIIKNKGRE